MPRAGKEIRSIRIFSSRSQKAWLTAIELIGSAVFMPCLATSPEHLPGFDAPLTWETTTISGLRVTRTLTSFVEIVITNGCLPRLTTTPINTAKNLALLLSDNSLIVIEYETHKDPAMNSRYSPQIFVNE